MLRTTGARASRLHERESAKKRLISIILILLGMFGAFFRTHASGETPRAPVIFLFLRRHQLISKFYRINSAQDRFLAANDAFRIFLRIKDIER